ATSATEPAPLGLELSLWNEPEQLQPPRLHIDIACECTETADVFDGPAFIRSVQRFDLAEKDRGLLLLRRQRVLDARMGITKWLALDAPGLAFGELLFPVVAGDLGHLRDGGLGLLGEAKERLVLVLRCGPIRLEQPIQLFHDRGNLFPGRLACAGA